MGEGIGMSAFYELGVPAQEKCQSIQKFKSSFSAYVRQFPRVEIVVWNIDSRNSSIAI